MFNDISYYPIFGKPLIMYLGIITLVCFLITATIGFVIHKGIRNLPFSWHINMARISIGMALLHGTLGVLAYF